VTGYFMEIAVADAAERMSIGTSCSVGLRRGIVAETSGEVPPAAEYAVVLYIGMRSFLL